MNTFEITTTDLEKLKSLISEFNTYYNVEKPWTFEDVDAQREIGIDIINIIEPIIDKK